VQSILTHDSAATACFLLSQMTATMTTTPAPAGGISQTAIIHSHQQQKTGAEFRMLIAVAN